MIFCTANEHYIDVYTIQTNTWVANTSDYLRTVKAGARKKMRETYLYITVSMFSPNLEAHTIFEKQ